MKMNKLAELSNYKQKDKLESLNSSQNCQNNGNVEVRETKIFQIGV